MLDVSCNIGEIIYFSSPASLDDKQVSDDGGSTAEIVRVFGGPAVGDIRARCLRLSDRNSSVEAKSVHDLLAHRLHSSDESMTLQFDSLSGTSSLI